MATGTYAPDPDLHVVDANGVPVSGGLVWTYIAGTTTPTPTYTDVGLLVPNTNPIVAGSDGRFVAFLAGGISYKFVYEMPAIAPAHGAVIATRDNILAVTTIAPGTAGAVYQFTQLTGTVNDFALTPGCAVLYCQNATPLTLTGFSGGVPGQRLTVFATLGQVNLPYLSTSSLVGNRLLTYVTTGLTSLAAGTVTYGSATFIYSGLNNRWEIVSHEQGAWITPAYSATDFAGASGGAWAVTAVQVVVMKYRLSGRMLQVAFNLSPTLVTSAPTYLGILNGQFGGFQLVTGIQPVALGYTNDLAGNPYVANASATQLGIQKMSGAAFVAGAAQSFAGTWIGEAV